MSDMAREVRRLAPWYHTFELPGGVVTSGYFDLRSVVGKLPLPASLAGMRCLDAAACEGFWSFELARRGAAEVVSLDLPDTDRQDWQGLPSREVRRAGSGMANEHFAARAAGAGSRHRPSRRHERLRRRSRGCWAPLTTCSSATS